MSAFRRGPGPSAVTVLIPADRMGAALRFYRDVLGFRPVAETAHRHELVAAMPGTPRLLLELTEGRAPRRATGFSFHVTDLEAARADMAERGYLVDEMQGGAFLITDPAGTGSRSAARPAPGRGGLVYISLRAG